MLKSNLVTTVMRFRLVVKNTLDPLNFGQTSYSLGRKVARPSWMLKFM